jgi:hypothetical protein
MVKSPLSSDSLYSKQFIELGINDFESACLYVQSLPYGRNTDRSDFSLVLSEGKGSCSGKHGLLAALAEENGFIEVELIAGIFLMSGETHPKLTAFFADKSYTTIPECHCYLRYKGQRFDYTDTSNAMERISSRIVREQRIEPHQVVEWKPKIHQEYLKGWLKRNPQVGLSFEEMWQEREACIAVLAGK